MEAILVAIGAVALAEMGDKTQLLAFLLASRFKKPTPIIPVFWSRRSLITPLPAHSARGSRTSSAPK